MCVCHAGGTMRGFCPRIIAAVATLLVTATASLAQSTGSIAGTVTIEGSARPLGSVTVTIARSPLGTQTDDGGAYRLTNVPVGTHDLRFQRIGYAPVTRQVTVAAGEVAR